MSAQNTTVEPNPAGVDALPPHESLDLRELGKRLQRVVAESEDEGQATERLMQLAARLTHAVAVVYFGEDTSGDLSATPLVHAANPIAEDTVNKLYSLGMMVRSGELVQIARSDQSPNQVAVAVPVLRLQRGTEVMVIMAGVEQEMNRRLAGLVQIAQFLAAFAGQWRGRLSEIRSSNEHLRLDRFCECLLESNAVDRLPLAASKMADGLSQLLSARLVAIGLCRAGRQVRLVALSNQFQFDRASELGKCLEAVLTETLLSGTSVNLDDVDGRQTVAVQQLLSMIDAPVIQRAILHDAHGNAIGACVMMCDQSPASQTQAGIELAQRMIGQQLDLRRRTPRRPIRRWANRFRASSRRQKTWILSLSAAAAVLVFVFPLPHRLKCKCEVQPVKRRFVAAPYEGRLQAAHVEPGDWVTEGQTIARMDAREIRLELASVEAEHVQAMKQRDTAMAERETAAAQLARFEMERLQLKLQMLQQRMDHLEIKSPTDGIVISGDPKKLEGARMSLGQTLVEVGPLGEMVLEVAIRAEDISHVKLNRAVSYRLESLPHARFEGVLTKLHPRSEQRNSENVFIGEVRIDANPVLRPGMRGRAKIEADRRPLFWLVFHRAWEQALFYFG